MIHLSLFGSLLFSLQLLFASLFLLLLVGFEKGAFELFVDFGFDLKRSLIRRRHEWLMRIVSLHATFELWRCHTSHPLIKGSCTRRFAN